MNVKEQMLRWFTLGCRYAQVTNGRYRGFTYRTKALAAFRAACCYREAAACARRLGERALALDYEAAGRQYADQQAYWVNRGGASPRRKAKWVM